MTRNSTKHTSALPKSFSNTTMMKEIAHITSSGASVPRSGTRKRPTRTVKMESISRFCAKYDAKKMTMQILAISPGWKLKGPSFSQMRLPRISWPRPGIMGESSKMMPSTMNVYLYCERRSMLRTTARVITMHAMPTNSQMIWLTAKSGARRVTNAMPMPERPNVMGKMAGSAFFARKRVAMCATTNAANRPRGAVSDSRESAVPC